MQKTFKEDVISGKIVKNTGQMPMYLIKDNHEGIVSRTVFQSAQAELARRKSCKSSSLKNAPTGRSCYSGKYALTERVICGECGTRYQRCSWHKRNKVRIVWRCVSRVEYGARYCKASPTMDEAPLQQAIMAAINSAMQPKEELVQEITDAFVGEIITTPDSTLTVGEIKRRRQELEDEFGELLAKAAQGSKETYSERCKEIKLEIAELKEQQESISVQLRSNRRVQERLHEITRVLDQSNCYMTEWNEDMIRQLIHTVKVISASQIKVTLYDGTEIYQEVHNQ